MGTRDSAPNGLGEFIASKPIEAITRKELMETELPFPGVGETELILRRNADDYRGKKGQLAEAEAVGGLEIGQLMPKSAEQAEADTQAMFNKLLAGRTDEEKASLAFLVVASNSKLGSLGTPDQSETDKQRFVDTGKRALEGIEKTIAANGLKEDQLLNRRAAGPRVLELGGLEDVLMVGQVQEYFDFLKAEAAKTGKNMWVLFENDEYEVERKAFGVEGPQEVADRMKVYMERVAKKAAQYHTRHQGKRLIVLTEIPRDLAGPYANIYMSGLSAKGHEIPKFENLGGMAWTINKDGVATATVGGETYTTNLKAENPTDAE